MRPQPASQPASQPKITNRRSERRKTRDKDTPAVLASLPVNEWSRPDLINCLAGCLSLDIYVDIEMSCTVMLNIPSG